MIDINAFKKYRQRRRDYSAHAYFQQEVAERLLARLPFMKIVPTVILDCGGDEYTLSALQARYPNAILIQHDVTQLSDFPYPKAHFDFIFANLSLHYAEDIFGVLSEFRRLLKKNGLLLFSTLGPDTLLELHQAFLQADEKWHVHPFMDMHPIGDELVRLQFVEPIVDMEKITLQYEALDDFFADLKNTASQNILLDRQRGLQGKKAWQTMIANYPKNADGYYPVTAEVIYGQAWINGPRLSTPDENNEVVFSLTDFF